jgi:hypothetical protein
MDPHGVVEYLLIVARPTHSLAKDDVRALHQMCEVAKEVCRQSALRVVRECEQSPCLQSCSADGTPISVSETVSALLPSGRVVRRRGKASHEFLVTTQFTRSSLPDGRLETTFSTTDPCPLTHGKAVDRIFESSRARWKSLRQLGHRGGAVQHYVYDRCGMQKMGRRQKQWHALVAPSFVGDDDDSLLLSRLEWIEVSACACHDLQNAFKWGFPDEFLDREVLRDCFIGCESMRNSFDVVLTYVHEWVATTIRPADPMTPMEKSEWKELWYSLGVNDEICDLLVGKEVRASDGYILVSSDVYDAADLVGQLVTLVLGVWSIRRFSDSRWLTVGPCARGIIGAALLGLPSFVSWVQKKPSVSGFFLNGFWRLKEPHWLFFAKAAMCSRVADAGLQIVMEDNRVARQADVLRQAMHDAASRIGDISIFIWDRLGGLSGCHGAHMRSMCIRAAHRTCAFTEFRVLRVADQLPWSLCRGDIADNLDLLKQGDRPADTTSGKLWDLLHIDYNKYQLVRMVELLGDAPWSTYVTEQLHASAALVSRHHPDYGLGTLLSRSLVITARKLLPAESKQQKGIARLQKRVNVLLNKCPEKAGARQRFFADLSKAGASRRSTLGASMRKKMQELIMKGHNKLYHRLSRDEKRQYHCRAKAAASKKRVQIGEDLKSLVDDLQKLKAKEEVDRDARKPLTISSSQWGEKDLIKFAELLESPHFAPILVRRLRDAASCAPQPMTDALEAALDSQEVDVASSAIAEPDWVREICARRDAFENVALRVLKGDAVETWMFILALMSPAYMCVCRLQDADVYAPCGAGALEDGSAAAAFARSFDFEWMGSKSGTAFVGVEAVHVEVLESMQYVGGQRVCTDAEPMSLTAFFALHPKKKTAPAGHARAQLKREEKASADELARELPWVEGIAKTFGGGESSAAPASDSESDPVELDVDGDALDDAAEYAWEELEKVRLRIGDSTELRADDFTVKVLGGVWTAAHRGVAADAIQGKSCG